MEPEHVLDRSKTPPIPSGTMPLQHQVAGHVFGRSNGHIVSKIGQCCCFYFVDVLCNVNLFPGFFYLRISVFLKICMKREYGNLGFDGT